MPAMSVQRGGVGSSAIVYFCTFLSLWKIAYANK
jgi:hypothetical protein